MPTWFPGAGFLKEAEANKAQIVQLIGAPIDRVQEELASSLRNDCPPFVLIHVTQTKGTAAISMASELLQNLHPDPSDKELNFAIRAVPANVYAGEQLNLSTIS
jgi:hypothetical protein